MKTKKELIFKIFCGVTGFAVTFFVGSAAFAQWTGPTVPPPGNNAPGFIENNTSSVQAGAGFNIGGNGTLNTLNATQICFPGNNCRNGWDAGVWQLNGTGAYYNAGNVGIGTDVPGNLLHVYRSSGRNAEIVIQSVPSANPTDWQHWGIYHDRNTENLRFWNNDSLGTKNVLSLDNNGRVGILADAPVAQLEIRAQANTPGLRIVSASNQDPLVIRDSSNVSNLVQVTTNGGINASGNVITQGRLEASGHKIESPSSVGGVLNATIRFDTPAWRLYAGTTERAVFTAQESGSVVIGDRTANNGLMLDVNGNVGAARYCDNIGNNCKTITELSGGGSSVWQPTAGGTGIYYSGGKVGIGTGAPNPGATSNALLHLRATSGNAEVDIQSGTGTHWSIYHDDGTEELRIWNGSNLVRMTSGQFIVDGNIWTNRELIVRDGGRLQLNSSANDYKFYVDHYADTLRVYGSQPGVSFGINRLGQVLIGSSISPNNSKLYTAGRATAQEFCVPLQGGGYSCTNNQTGFSGQQIWQLNGTNAYYNGGKVGIGTSAPNRHLHIKSPANVNAEIDLQTGDNSMWAMYYAVPTNGLPKSLRFWNEEATNGGNALVLTNAGRLGVGVHNPTQALDVNGQIVANNRITATEFCLGSGSCVNNATGFATPLWQQSSGNNIIYTKNGQDVRALIRANANSSKAEINLLTGLGPNPLATNLSNTAGDFFLYTTKGGAAVPFYVSANGQNSSVGINLPLYQQPSATLDVNGFVQLNQQLLVRNNGRVALFSGDNSSYYFMDNYGKDLRIMGSGNEAGHSGEPAGSIVLTEEGDVSIGSAVPFYGAKLYVRGKITGDALEVIASNRATTKLQGNNTTDWVGTSIHNTAGEEEWFVGSTNNSFVVQRDGMTDRKDLVINTDGNVGIGTVSPTKKVDVDVSTVSDGIRVKRGINSNGLSINMGNLHPWIDFTNGITFVPNSYNTLGTWIWSDGSAPVLLQLTAANGGRVGVGTQSPTDKLDVNADNIRIRSAKTPARNATCDQGEISWDANYIYVCVANNQWKRTSLSSY